MAETHRRRTKIGYNEAWSAAYEIASSPTVQPDQEQAFKALLPRIKDIDSVPPSLLEVRLSEIFHYMTILISC